MRVPRQVTLAVTAALTVFLATAAVRAEDKPACALSPPLKCRPSSAYP